MQIRISSVKASDNRLKSGKLIVSRYKTRNCVNMSYTPGAADLSLRRRASWAPDVHEERTWPMVNVLSWLGRGCFCCCCEGRWDLVEWRLIPRLYDRKIKSKKPRQREATSGRDRWVHLSPRFIPKIRNRRASIILNSRLLAMGRQSMIGE